MCRICPTLSSADLKGPLGCFHFCCCLAPPSSWWPFSSFSIPSVFTVRICASASNELTSHQSWFQLHGACRRDFVQTFLQNGHYCLLVESTDRDEIAKYLLEKSKGYNLGSTKLDLQPCKAWPTGTIYISMSREEAPLPNCLIWRLATSLFSPPLCQDTGWLGLWLLRHGWLDCFCLSITQQF